ncbi:hypothetical protein OG2516_15339 [Oceanicola granulosus HTCC2516]|uniref:Potassium channel domain-containing protein n=1 Tax=Oceanicola granulosus (strain ATCC BAA-861 / DSM 15982 / KCTC 12143 / HTCC2516) TaxID=314256 RepID=Q2CFE5_OCEGH|nr:ion channel [Oceanicola granulosus]EAR51350.1 hypothetical protein OG2516_15339 [Oceanicola granulosus HTCC2516]
MIGLGIGVLLVVLLGVFHHLGLLVVRALNPGADTLPKAAILVVFISLLVLHVVEILGFAVAYRLLLDWGALGTLTAEFSGSWEGLIYFSGVNFATLGYTQIQTEGPIRMVNMMQSLGGFMVLTWSATFLYSTSERAWKA